MSTPHTAASPSRPPRRQPPNTPGRGPQRRNRQNRATLPRAGDAPPNPSVEASDSAVVDSDSAALSGEEIPFKGRRNVRKHNQSQSMSARKISPPNLPTASLTDSERGPNKPTTPAKAAPVKATPVKTVAYAGPSFHSSPAPSSLPIPKFLSKSVPAKAPAPLEEGSDSASPPTPSPPTPSRNSITLPYKTGGAGPSALDFLFKADREEKAKTGTGSPRSVAFANPVQPAPFGAPLHHPQNDSSTSLNGMFPIELDADASNQYNPSSPAPLSGYRSVTAPSRIPQLGPESQTENTSIGDYNTPASEDAAALQALLGRLAQTQGQRRPADMTPPRVVDHMPSEPSSRHHTPSPFYNPGSATRSASGPTTPVNSMQQPSGDHIYGNRNLSPLFKSFQSEGKRNSGLRTEITPDSPTAVPKLDFQSIPQGPQAPRSNVANHNPFNNVAPPPAGNGNGNPPFGAPTGPKQSPGPRPSYHAGPQHHNIGNHNNGNRSPARRPYNPHPRGYQNPRFKESVAVTLPKPKPPVVNPFIPASVQAKQYAKPKPTTAEKERDTATASDTQSLEQQLKSVLNLNQKPADMAGVH